MMPFPVGRHTYGHEGIKIIFSKSVLRIGAFCSIGGGVIVYTGGDHHVEWVSTFPFQKLTPNCNIHSHLSKGDVTIGNDVWIANNVTIMSGVTIGDGAVIGTNSLVSNDVGAYEVWAGNPATFKRKRFTDAQIEALLKIKWWNWADDKIIAEAKLLSSDKIDEFIERHINETDGN